MEANDFFSGLVSYIECENSRYHKDDVIILPKDLSLARATTKKIL